MSTEQLISSVAGSSWGDIGEELEEKLSSGDRYGKKRGKKKNDNEKKQGLIKGGQKSNRSVGSVVARASTSKVSQQEGIVKEEGSPNKSLEFFKKVNHGMEGKLESKKASEDSLANVQSKIDSRLDQRAHVIGSNPRIGNDEDLQKRFVEKSSATEGKQGEKMTLIRNISADKRQLEKNGEEYELSEGLLNEQVLNAHDAQTALRDVGEKNTSSDVVSLEKSDGASSGEKDRSGFFGSPEYKQVIDDQSPDISATQRGGIDWEGVKKDFDEEGKRIQEERVRSVKFNRLDAQETFDEETEKLKNHDKLAERFRDVKNFDELLVLLSDPEFPGIQGSKQFYSGDDLKRIIAIARETGATNFATRSHGFLDMVERLLREEKEGKMGALKEDDIVEGFGVVSEKASELALEEDVKDLPLEDKMKNKTERGGTFDAAISDDLKELYGKAIDVQKACDEAGRLYAEAQGREDSLRTKVMSFFRFMKPSLKDEIQKKNQDVLDLKSKWQRSLTKLRQVKLEIAKQEAKKSGLAENEVKKKVAEVLIESDLREAVKVYEEWKEAKRGDRRESKIAKYVEDLVKRYRELPSELKVAVGLLLFLASFIPGAKPLVLVLGIPLRGLGAAGIAGGGKGLHERIAGWFSQREKKAEMSRKWNDADLVNLQKQAGKSQEQFDALRRKDKRRTVAWAGAGLALFLGGTAFSLAHAASAAERVVESGGGGRVVQEALLAKGADVPGVPHADTTKEMLATAKKLAIEGQVKSVPVPSVAEVAVPVSDTSGLLSDSVGSGIIDHGSSVEVAGDIGKSLADMKIAAVPRGGSFERVLIEKLMGVGVAKEEAGKLAHQAMLDLAEKSGRPFEMFNDIQPGAEIQYEIGPDKSLSVFGVTREAGGEAIQRIADSTLEGGHASTVGQTIKESLPLSPKPADAVPVPSVQMPSPDPFPKMPEVNLESPQDIFERVLPKVPQAPSLEDTLSGNVSLDTSVSAPSLESLPVEASAPVHDFESLDLSVPGGEYLKNIGTVVKERLTFLPLSETQKDLIENIFSARIPTAGTEPTTSSVLFVRDALGKALFSSGDVERWMRVDIEQVRERVNKAVYAGLVRIGGESLRIKEMVAEGETVKGWLTKMARHILTHPIEPAK